MESNSQKIIENGFVTYTFRECKILITKDMGRWHMSISHPSRYPSWDEIRDARYKYLPENIFIIMVLPPKGNYVNVHPYCFHLWETRDPEANEIWSG